MENAKFIVTRVLVACIFIGGVIFLVVHARQADKKAWEEADEAQRHANSVQERSLDMNSRLFHSRQQPDDGTIHVTAQELFDAFTQNQLAAESKYKGKVLTVTGKVSMVMRDSSTLPLGNGQVAVLLAPSMGCSTSDTAKAATLVAEQLITVRGILSRTVGLVPIITDCTIE